MLRLLFALITSFSGATWADAETIDVKYYGKLDLAPFACIEVTRSSFINVPATANQFMVVQRKYPSSVALWRTSASALMGTLSAVWSNH